MWTSTGGASAASETSWSTGTCESWTWTSPGSSWRRNSTSSAPSPLRNSGARAATSSEPPAGGRAVEGRAAVVAGLVGHPAERHAGPDRVQRARHAVRVHVPVVLLVVGRDHQLDQRDVRDRLCRALDDHRLAPALQVDGDLPVVVQVLRRQRAGAEVERV